MMYGVGHTLPTLMPLGVSCKGIFLEIAMLQETDNLEYSDGLSPIITWLRLLRLVPGNNVCVKNNFVRYVEMRGELTADKKLVLGVCSEDETEKCFPMFLIANRDKLGSS